MKEFKVLISALFVLILMACGDKRADERIVSVTIEPQRYFAEKIAGDKFKMVIDSREDDGILYVDNLSIEYAKE